MSCGFEYWQNPHWTNRSDYPGSGDSMPDWRWRWEFLRRDGDYQKAWLAGTPIEGDENRLAHPRDYYRVQYLYRLANLYDPAFDASELLYIFTPYTGVVTRWVEPYDFLEAVEILKPADLLAFFRVYFAERQLVSERIREGSLATALFDLNRPLSPQLKQVGSTLREQQKHQSGNLIQFRKRQELWPIYLRLLDAENQGDPKAMTIYNHLLKEAEAQDVSAHDRLCVDQPATLISDWQNQAKELRTKAINYL